MTDPRSPAEEPEGAAAGDDPAPGRGRAAGGAAAGGGPIPVVEIKARENGPYRVQGPIRLIDADGNEYDLGGRGEVIALCRCGGSTTKPFCDGTHSRTGFQAAERAVAGEESEGA